MENRVQYMTRLEVKSRIEHCPIAIVPIGATEQHGNHLPLGTDIFLAEKLSQMVADKTGALLFPSLNYGYSWVWRDIAGTISLDTEHLQSCLIDIVKSVERYGIKLIVFINGHEANSATLKYAVRKIQDESHVKVLGMFYPSMSKIYKKYIESETWGGIFHACEFETSLMLMYDENLVNMDLAQKEYPKKPPLYGIDNTSLGTLSKSGVYGNPTLASKEKGRLMFEEFTNEIVNLINIALE